MTRRVALPLAALMALATLPALAGTAPAGASGTVSPAARGADDNGDPEPAANHEEAEQDDCPTELWTVPLEIKGLVCILILPKSEEEGGEEAAGGGLGGLLG
ncbi:MAG TPA: hypothetical protein VEG38_03245 [Acidimicrobiia bacterium]|nr:hypothetical protein [Acidimicrobiia bacterium]